MSKTKKPWWLKLIYSILSLILIVALILVGVWAFVKIKYDINLINTIAQIKTLNEPVNENEKFTNVFTISDMASAQTEVNSKSSNLIIGNETDGYKIQSGVSLSSLSGDIKLTDKQIAAILDNLLHQEGNNAAIQIGSQSLSINLIQMLFKNIQENSAEINIVIKLDTNIIKESMSSFPFNLISKYIPETLYLSSTVVVNKLEGTFNYNVEYKEMLINNLTTDETESFLKILNLVLKTGTSEQLCANICKPFVDAMIGNETNNGFAYSLKGLGATDYNFVIENNINYFVVKK